MKRAFFASLLLGALLGAGCNFASGTTTTDLSVLEAQANAAAAAANPSSSSSNSSSAPQTNSSSSGSSSSSSGSSSSGSSSGSSPVAAASGPSGGFLWKPISESDGNLVVLLPSAYVNVGSISISGSKSASASRSTIANGNRPHYRFPLPGAAYGKNITVSGGGQTWTVPDGSKRTTR